MRSEISFDLDRELIVVDAVVIGPTGRAQVRLVLDTGAVLTTEWLRDPARGNLHARSHGTGGRHANVADLGYGLDGVLGMNFLLDFHIEIRPAERRIRVEKIAP